MIALAAYPIGFAPVRNFSRQTYDAGSQNWAVTQDSFGRVYFANRDGMLKYDGIRWSLYFLPNYTTVRSVLADKSGRIYAGGSGEFGFFHTDSLTLTLKYVSLSTLLPEKEKSFTEIWNIHKLNGDGYAFQGDFRIFLYRNGSFTVTESKDKLTASGIIGGNLYAATQSGELLLYSDGALKKAGRLPFPNRIVALLPWQQGKMLIVTATAGLYTYQSGTFTEERRDISPFLITNQTFCATNSGTSYAFGTVTGGAVVTDTATGTTNYINKQTGLMNNTVLGMGFDFSANLWLCLDNGLGYAMVDSPVFNLLGNESEAGAGYASLLTGNHLLLATNRGLYSTAYPFSDRLSPPVLTRLHSGQVWSIDSVGKDIFISADDGLFVMNGATATLRKLPGLETGCWTVLPLKTHPGKAVVSTYNGFYLLDNPAGFWTVAGRISGYDDAGGKFVEDDEGTLWFAHWIKGVYRLILAPDLKRFANVKLYTSRDGLPSERENSLTLRNGKLRISTASGEFFQPGPDGRMIRDDKLSTSIPIRNSVHYHTLPSGVSFAFSPKAVWKLTEKSPGKMEIDSVSFRRVAGSLIPGFEHIAMVDGDNLLVAHQEGFYNINLRNRTHQKWHNGVFVESLASGDSIIFSGLTDGKTPSLRIPYSLNSLTFSFAAPEYRFENAVLYSCRLDNYDKEWSTLSESSSKEYTQLGEGHYTLRVRAFNTITGEVAETALEFTILPPWYRSVPAKLIYGLLIILLIYAGYKLFRYLSQRNARKMKEQKEAEMEMMRKEAEKDAIRKDYEIASLKSEQLEQDIKHKSSELSNTTMNVIRKNEILLDISSRLRKINEKTDGGEKSPAALQREIDKIRTLIHDNISHDDDWKKFHQNFDIVYSDFTSRLAELHPNLTIAEKRLCCYLKMGLSSKEIAPIFSISPKSVEMNRYRLRQKLGLERSDNLVEYLQGI